MPKFAETQVPKFATELPKFATCVRDKNVRERYQQAARRNRQRVAEVIEGVGDMGESEEIQHTGRRATITHQKVWA